MISEKRGAFWNNKNQRFHRNRGSFKVRVSDFFNMENTDGLHKFPVSWGTGGWGLGYTFSGFSLQSEFIVPSIHSTIVG